MRIAALDNEACELDLIRHTMAAIGHECHGFEEGKSLLHAMSEQGFDLLILDWSLPDIEGLSVVRWIRETLSSKLPILFPTHRRAEEDMVEALAAGADDFMAKPIRVAELQARVRALLRHAYPARHETELIFGPFRFLLPKRTLHISGRAAGLNYREYDLAVFLFQNLGRMLSREHLLEAVWGVGTDTPSRTLAHVHVAPSVEAGPASVQRAPAVGRLRTGLPARVRRQPCARAAVPPGGHRRMKPASPRKRA